MDQSPPDELYFDLHVNTFLPLFSFLSIRNHFGPSPKMGYTIALIPAVQMYALQVGCFVCCFSLTRECTKCLQWYSSTVLVYVELTLYIFSLYTHVVCDTQSIDWETDEFSKENRFGAYQQMTQVRCSLAYVHAH